MFPLIVAVLNVITFIDFFPPSQERRHWLIFLGIRVSVSEFDVNNGFSLLTPLTLYHDIAPRILVLVTTLTYFPL